MKIGLFTDTYRPSINGIVYVVETLKANLEKQGHTVYIFCPARTIIPSHRKEYMKEDNSIISLPSFSSGLFDDFDFTLFFPPMLLSKIKKMDLDVIHIFTPSQIGLLGIRAAMKHNTPLVVQHCTDLYEFVDHYPAVLPGVLALIGFVYPMTVKLKGHDIKELIKMYRPRYGVTKWNKEIISRAITMLYSKSDIAIALSRKSKKQLESWQDDVYHYPVSLMPNGVDMLPDVSEKILKDFWRKWGILETDKVFGFVGRLGEEKNLPILIEAMDIIGKKNKNAKLMFVGDFDFRKKLEEIAADSLFPDRIIFTGSMERESLNLAYRTFDVFAFPSLKDTQGWVLHEAAHAGLPIVLIDKELSEVVIDGENGYFAENTRVSVAEKVLALLGDDKKRKEFGDMSRKLAKKFTEEKQVKKLIELYDQVIFDHRKINSNK